MYLYKKWNFIIFLNNLVVHNFLIIQKKILFLKFDVYKYYFFNFSKETNIVNNRIINLKNKITQTN